MVLGRQLEVFDKVKIGKLSSKIHLGGHPSTTSGVRVTLVVDFHPKLDQKTGRIGAEARSKI